MKRARERCHEWIEQHNSDSQPLQRTRMRERYPLFVTESDFEQRVDFANGSVVASDLSERPQPPAADDSSWRVSFVKKHVSDAIRCLLARPQLNTQEILSGVACKVKGREAGSASELGLLERDSK